MDEVFIRVTLVECPFIIHSISLYVNTFFKVFYIFFYFFLFLTSFSTFLTLNKKKPLLFFTKQRFPYFLVYQVPYLLNIDHTILIFHDVQMVNSLIVYQPLIYPALYE